MSTDPASSLVQEVLALIDDVGVPPELREIAFSKVFDLKAGLTSPAATAAAGAGPQIKGTQTPAPAGDWATAIANRLELTSEKAESLYFIDGDQLELLIPPNRLDSAKAKATEQIALLVIAGRQAAGLDEDWSSVDPIRAVCEHYKRYDSSNFAATIKGMSSLFSVRGSGRDRKLKMTAPAWHRAAELAAELGGG